MKTKSKNYVPTFTKSQGMEFARFCTTCDSMQAVAIEARRVASTLVGGEGRGTWKKAFLDFATAIENGKLPSSIFAMKGNIKLPFVAFSTLPVVTCPGAGDCAEWCYSFRAWRYPAAFLRQCSNTLLLRFNRRAIIDAFQKLPQGITFRLYVDGDFSDASVLAFWMRLLGQRPDIRAYGYSKSWELLLTFHGAFPPNYVLNISSGSVYDGNAELKNRMLALPITRGEFVGVKLKRNHAKGRKKYDSADYHKDVRESAALAGYGKVFSCTGTCNECTNQGHACGIVELKIPVAIGIH